MSAHPSSLRRLRLSCIAAAALLTTLAGCGYKGPLYLPPPPAPDKALTTPPTSQLGTEPTAAQAIPVAPQSRP